jgi:hypothetical protein
MLEFVTNVREFATHRSTPGDYITVYLYLAIRERHVYSYIYKIYIMYIYIYIILYMYMLHIYNIYNDIYICTIYNICAYASA